MGKQKECARCNSPWEWVCEEVHDFNLSTGKRIWPSICIQCRSDLEQKFKGKKITHTELMMEFSNISARASKKCTRNAGEVAEILRQMKNFTPKRRGK